MKNVLSCLLCCLAAVLLCRPVQAEGSGVSVEIPLTVQAAEGCSAAEAVSYFSITAEENTPMPLQSTLCIRGAGKGSFGPIGYTLPGDYTYVVRQTSAAAIFRRDATIYTVTVRIVNNAQGSLSAEVWAVREDDTTGKTSRLVFTAVPLSYTFATAAPVAAAFPATPATPAKPAGASTAATAATPAPGMAASPGTAAKAGTSTVPTRTKTNSHRTPQTGDDSSPLLAVLCCIGSAAAVVVLYRRKND